MRCRLAFGTSLSGPPPMCDRWVICFVIGSWGSCHNGDSGSWVDPASLFGKVFVSGDCCGSVVQGMHVSRWVLNSWFLSAVRHSIQRVSAQRSHGCPLLQAATSGVAKRWHSFDGLPWVAPQLPLQVQRFFSRLGGPCIVSFDREDWAVWLDCVGGF